MKKCFEVMITQVVHVVSLIASINVNSSNGFIWILPNAKYM